MLRASIDAVWRLRSNTAHFSARRSPSDHGLPFYDALIVSAAIEAGCDTLFSEDMQHGRSIGGLAIVNPFVDSAA